MQLALRLNLYLLFDFSLQRFESCKTKQSQVNDKEKNTTKLPRSMFLGFLKKSWINNGNFE